MGVMKINSAGEKRQPVSGVTGGAFFSSGLLSDVGSVEGQRGFVLQKAGAAKKRK